MQYLARMRDIVTLTQTSDLIWRTLIISHGLTINFHNLVSLEEG